CRNASNIVSTCSSSLRYKSDVATFSRGLDVVRRLRPISLRWRDSGPADVGCGAEEVNAIEPLLAIRNAEGAIEGVKYKQITTVLVNAVNEQQQQIDEQKKRIDRLEAQLKAQQVLIDRLLKRAGQGR